MCELSLILPAYNEEASLKAVIASLVQAFEHSKVGYELILVDNGSFDHTPGIIQQLASKNPRLKAVSIQVNQGFGWGVICGLKKAHGRFIGYMASDGQVAPQDVVKVFEAIRVNGYDVAKAKRVVREDGFVRKVLSFCYNWLFAWLFHVRSLDINGTPKIFRRELLKEFNLVSKDWFIDAEFMIKANYLKLRLSEVPIQFLPRRSGRSAVSAMTIVEFLKNMLSYKIGRRLKQWQKSRS